MTDITDHTAGIREAWERGVAGPLAEFLTVFARGIAARPDVYSDDLVNSARAVLATVEAPAPTLAEELRELNKRDIPLGALLDLAARAAQVEQDRDDAIEEVERQVKIADGLRTTAGMAQRERDALRTQLEEARMAAEGHAQDAMDAADERDQLRDELRAITTGRTFTTPDLESEIVSTLDTAIRTVLTGLHITTQRVITDPDDLDALPDGTVIIDQDDQAAAQKIDGQWFEPGVGRSINHRCIIHAVVLWKPGEAKQ